ncbi:ferrochelatase [Lentilactobacillus sp. Marseille-Q4993]|uniref:ferrochelatase n=1 Tax=Lentilactobacillus sp. Marseille-Q4993 TaxID=3039492 RepID=UPI0024BC90B4|nr:ferrochelatase [Lentilactobacillus sp. Marseille-Q4993]
MKKGLLLVNTGSPKTPTTADVKAYLKVFLSDQNVIEMPRWVWQPILRGFVLPLRSWRSATYYQRIWTRAGSPLVAYTQIMTANVQAELPDWDVRFAMSYSEPRIADQMQDMKDKGCDEINVLPMYPQYTQSTHKAIYDQADASGIEYQKIDNFYREPEYQRIMADKISQYIDKQEYDEVLFSYHGIPTAMVKHGDPYQKECEETTEGILSQIPAIKAISKTVYQSKFGPAPWLKPYLKNYLTEMIQMGKRRVLIVAPSFIVDGLETLEENGVQNYQTFKENGGDVFHLVEPLNGDKRFAKFLADLVMK